MTEYRHDMPFGATLQPDGTTAFRLWAPQAERVGLVIDGTEQATSRNDEGWFVAETSAPAGTAYAYRIGELTVPDPAARAQAEDVHGPSLVVDPHSYDWQHTDWRGRPWEEAVIVELHVGTATPEGTFDGLRQRLGHYRDLGITAIELLPVADFPGQRNWGYDGVLPYAPDRAYGEPDDLKRLIDEAHGMGLMVFLDVVYNHFGPDGNYLHTYAEDFFDADRPTPWGAGLDFSNPVVADFFTHNAAYWIEEYRFDGLRFDAVHAIENLAEKPGAPFLKRLARRCREAAGPDRHVHLILENDDNRASLLAREDGRPAHYDAQWNDDLHHVLHRLVTGETDGYYQDYADAPHARLARCLGEGFDYQGERSPHRDRERGEASGFLPPTAFCSFLQNHDQVGNRAFGERITEAATGEAVEAATALYLLAPQIPMLFMGEEWAASTPFPFFCDFHGELADAVREGRRREFRSFKGFQTAEAREAIPDPNAHSTYEDARLDWDELAEPVHAERLDFFRQLIALRHRHLVPLLRSGAPETQVRAEGSVLLASYAFPAGTWQLLVNLADAEGAVPAPPEGERLFARADCDANSRTLPGWTVEAWMATP
jgi:maltooligosyltrehalose trehalohydrolase